MLGQKILLELADWPFHASVLIILVVLLLDGNVGEMHVKVLHVCLVRSIPGRRETAEATPAQLHPQLFAV